MANKHTTLIEAIKLRNGIGIGQKRIGFKRFVKKIFFGWKPSGDQKLLKGVNVEMVIDREKKEYHQVVTNVATGEVLHEENESLTQHRLKPKAKKR